MFWDEKGQSKTNAKIVLTNKTSDSLIQKWFSIVFRLIFIIGDPFVQLYKIPRYNIFSSGKTMTGEFILNVHKYTELPD